MSRKSLLALTGLRVDGRREGELRHVSMRFGEEEAGSGVAYYQQGNTHVCAVVTGPRESNRKGDRNGAVIECEVRGKGREGREGGVWWKVHLNSDMQYNMAAFSTGERKQPMKRDRRSVEIALLLKRTFEAVVHTERFPNSQIDIVVTVLSADGGTRCAAINAVTLALVDAGIPMKDLVVACAAGRVDDRVLLDLNFAEDSQGLDLPVAVLASSGKVVMCQMDHKMPIGDFKGVLQVAIDGSLRIAELMREVVRQRAKLLSAGAEQMLQQQQQQRADADRMDEDDD